MSTIRSWFDAQSTGAPAALRERAARYLEAASNAAEGAVPLADAAMHALAATLSRPGDRTAALDLLAADALVTLALKARAASHPAGLLAFASALRHSGSRIR